jgi:hypothetical protein
MSMQLARLPEYVELGGLGAALNQAEHGHHAPRTFRFRHTGNLQTKYADARRVLGMTLNYQAQFKALADRLALEPIAPSRLEHSVLRHLWTIDEDTGAHARQHRERTIAGVLDLFAGRGIEGDTTGNSPGSKSCAWNAIAEHLDTAGDTHSAATRCSDPSRTPRSNSAPSKCS